MGRSCWVIHLLLMCSLGTKLIAVNAQSVALSKVSPVGDPVEGNVVELRCLATGLMAGYIIEWTRLVIVERQRVSIARNEMSVDSRYTLSTSMASGAQNKIETLIFYATKEDTGVVYGCRVRDSVGPSSTVVMIATQTISFEVLYFPSAMYPICIPDGPFTVQEGTTLNMSCTTEIGNPAVQMQILTSSVVYLWGYNRDSKEQLRSLQLIVTAANDGGSYHCRIGRFRDGSETTQFRGMERSCTIGPLAVDPLTTPTHTMP